MMRDNMGLYRGKRVDGGEWVEGQYGKDPYGNVYIFGNGYEGIDDCFHALDCHSVDPATVGQFTGLCDRTKRRMFEGDRINDPEEGTGRVEFWNGSYIVALDNPWDPMMTWYYLDNRIADKLEVIGTIHDAKEG
jgi:hypothetical protein